MGAAAGGAERVRADERTAARRSAAGGAAADCRVRVRLDRDHVLRLDGVAPPQSRGNRDARARAQNPRAMTAGHFIFIPSVLLIGVIVGWVLGSRAARDAYSAELRRREEKAARAAAKGAGEKM